MTLEETIKSCEEKAAKNEERAYFCMLANDKEKESEYRACAYEDKMLASWLKELKTLRMVISDPEEFIKKKYKFVAIEGYEELFGNMKALTFKNDLRRAMMECKAEEQQNERRTETNVD